MSFQFPSNAAHSLMHIGDALRNRAALLTLLCSCVGAAVLSGIGVASGVPVLAALFMLAGYVVLLLGAVTAGRQFMDQAQGRPVSATLPAFQASPLVVLRMLGLLLILGAVGLAWALVAGLLLYLCRIPGLGGLLLIVVMPVLTFSGVIVFLGIYVTWCLSAPALFEGHTLKRALAQLWAVISQRPLEAFLQLLLLCLVVGLVVTLLGGFIGMAFFTTVGMATGILGEVPMGMGMRDMMGDYGQLMSGGRVYGMFIGSGIVWAVVGVVFGALMLYGLCLTYLKLTDGLNVEAAEAAFESALARTREKAQQAAEEARRRAQDLQEAARQRAEQARQAGDASSSAAAGTGAAAGASEAQAPAAAPAEPAAQDRTVIVSAPPAAADTAAPAGTAPTDTPPAAPACPVCHAPVAADDVFCGGCGHKLKG
ncbi:zinc ribbon domain-containing protein [Caldimonas thermodepolymerans]|uniref:zinc ribbon domain-containing protein n=1 Tax=Caldimonas thermodepolymerans TaxID=215580 RepID=UPI0022360009|nr:zinc ribbon domain-containing protein [Caldimonas thermodepolymerans]UZG44007.1 hypothetical protein ONZ46_16745 [Caldimonas thermodepolymerans]